MKPHASLVGLVVLAALARSQEAEPPKLMGSTGQEHALPVLVETLAADLDGGPGGMEVDAAGFVYCADFGSQLGPGSTGGGRIYRIDPESGVVELFAEGLRGASGNAIGPDGDFFQSNIATSTVSRIRPDGTATTYLRENLRQPVGIAIDAEGLLFVASCGANTITEVAPDGSSSILATSPLFACPNGITLDDAHNLYVSNFMNGDVLKVTPLGEVTRLATLPGNNNGHLVHHAGQLYVVARGAHQIFKVSLTGKVELFAGSGERGHTNGPALEASFSFPNDLAFSPDGKTLYVNENASTTEPSGVLAPMTVRRLRLSN